MEIEFKIDAEEALFVFDDMLNWRQRRNVLRAAKNAAGNIIRKRAAQLAPVGSYPPQQIAAGRIPGRLKRSLNKAKTGITITRRHKNVYVVAGLSEEDPFYARFVEMGHTIRRVRRGPIFGHVEGKKFMERAATETEGRAYKAFADKFIQSTYRQIEMAKRRAKARARRR